MDDNVDTGFSFYYMREGRYLAIEFYDEDHGCHVRKVLNAAAVKNLIGELKLFLAAGKKKKKNESP